MEKIKDDNTLVAIQLHKVENDTCGAYDGLIKALTSVELKDLGNFNFSCSDYDAINNTLMLNLPILDRIISSLHDQHNIISEQVKNLHSKLLDISNVELKLNSELVNTDTSLNKLSDKNNLIKDKITIIEPSINKFINEAKEQLSSL
jgi:hypothetical protein